MDEKMYLLNGSPVSARDLIQAALDTDPSFKDSWFKTTSMAAMVLRKQGSTVEKNPDYKEQK